MNKVYYFVAEEKNVRQAKTKVTLKERFNTYYDNTHLHSVIQDVCEPFTMDSVDYRRLYRK